ncbi:hypothetical protein Btru_041509 [Bulinus truncatus]|nr:hypothetical protein Btru_041509 [Bulinus truncatus]
MLPCTNQLYNAAQYKPAVQSTSWFPYYAHLPVDGSRDSNLGNGHCQATLSQDMPWWMVDLRGQFVVDTIRLTNRMDYNLYFRLKNFTIDIFDQDPRQMTNFPNVVGNVFYQQDDSLNQETLNITCPNPITGRYVRLLLNVSDGILDFCEMEIFVEAFVFDLRHFTRRMDTKLSGSVLDTLGVSDPSRCASECLDRRSTACTAFNWVTTSKTCQLFSVNPNIDLMSNLSSAAGTHFYRQDNSF